jgi:hypothetical protein
MTDNLPAISRDHNKQNQVTRVGASYAAFDNNGNTTQDETGKTFKFDAWNSVGSA